MSNERNRAPGHISEVPGCIGGLLIDLFKVGGPLVGITLVALAGAGAIDRAGIDSSTDLFPQPTRDGDGVLVATPAPVYATPITYEAILPTPQPIPTEDICAMGSEVLGKTITLTDKETGKTVTGIARGASNVFHVEQGSGFDRKIVSCHDADTIIR